MEQGTHAPSALPSGAMYRVKEVAPLLGVSIATVYNLIASGDLPAFSVGPGRGTKRIPQADFVAYQERCRARAAHRIPTEATEEAA